MRRRILVMAVIAGLLGLASGAPAVAADNPPVTDAEFYSIVNKAWDTGRVTKAERAKVESRRDLAATTIDPTSAKADYELPGYVADPLETNRRAAGTTSTSPTGMVAAAYATRTTSRDRYIVYENWLHSKLLDYHFVVSWSYNGYAVVGQPGSYTYVANCAGSCQNLGIQSNDQYPNYSGGRIYAWTVPLRAEFIYCKGDCDLPRYPTVRFGVYYDGNYNYTVLSKG